MAKSKNKDFKNNLNQAIHNSRNPWEMQQNVQQQLQSMGVNYTKPVKQGLTASKQDSTDQQGSKSSKPDITARKPISMPDNDINQLMDKLGDKLPPGIKQMLDQFIPIIPDLGSMDNPKLKKEMKKKLKGFSSAFKSPYE